MSVTTQHLKTFLIIDSQAYSWPISCFYTSGLTWTTIGARGAPGQTRTTVCVIFVTYAKSYLETTEWPRFWRQTVKVEVRTGAIVKNSVIL